MSETKKCAHPSCGCQVPDGKKYCGDRCESSKKATEITCQCGHPACSGSGLKA